MSGYLLANYVQRRRSMHKRFDDLTIADDFMFCSVMQDPALCKKLLLLVLADTIGTILLADLKGSSSDASPLGKN